MLMRYPKNWPPNTKILPSMKFGYLLLLFMGLCGASPAQKSKLDLNKPEDNLTAFIKMRASTKEGEETVYYWHGTVYSYIPGQRSQALFGLEAYNVARIVKVEGGYQMLTREVALYKDLQTGQILERWYNPFIQDTVDVVQVWNDPVNQQLMLKGRAGNWGVPWHRLGDGRISMNSDIFLFYPSPLKKAEFPENSRSDDYQAAELFQFFFNEADLNHRKKHSIYSEVAWTRISDFLPWMRMADRPGYLVYQCRGYKLMNGAFDALPTQMQEYVKARQPQFMRAPEAYASPNMTSWKYFYELKKGKAPK